MPILTEPYWQTTDEDTVRLYHGDALQCLRSLRSESVQCVITSPPYWGLRDYKAGDQEIGCERTPTEYVDKMVKVFREVRRVLRRDGTVWLNIGDGYYKSGIQQGEIVGMPWRLAFALQRDGWMLRQDIIWAKTNPMPESVTNRCSKSHEYVFLLSRTADYYYDGVSIQEKAKSEYKSSDFIPRSVKDMADDKRHTSATGASVNGRSDEVRLDTANKRTVWSVAVGRYPGSHFAIFPDDLIRPMILAGTSDKGCCVQCGTPWKRVVERMGGEKSKDHSEKERDRSFQWSRNGIDGSLDGTPAVTKTVGWEPQCRCGEQETTGCVVLDPFMGSGTTADVALRHDRRVVGIDLKEEYLRDHVIGRVESILWEHDNTRHLVPKRPMSAYRRT